MFVKEALAAFILGRAAVNMQNTGCVCLCVAMVIWAPNSVYTVWASCARCERACITVSGRERVEIETDWGRSVYAQMWVHNTRLLPRRAHSRVVCGESFSSLAVALDGFHGSGVKDPLAHGSLAIPPCLAWLTPISLVWVQGVHTQQQAVVHDLKALQHLTQGSSHSVFARNWSTDTRCSVIKRIFHSFSGLCEHRKRCFPGFDTWPSATAVHKKSTWTV